MSIADSFLQGLQAPLQVPQAGLPMDMTPYVTALPDLKQHEQKVREQARMQKYIDEMAAKIKKENLAALDEPSFLEGEEKMAFVSSNPWIRRKWLEKVANPSNPFMSTMLPDNSQSIPDLPAEPPPTVMQDAEFDTISRHNADLGLPQIPDSMYQAEDIPSAPNENKMIAQKAQEREIDLRNRFMEGRVNDDDIIAYGKLKEEEAKRLQDRIALQRGGPGLSDEEIRQLRALQPSNQRLTDIARRNRQQYQRRIKNTLDSAANPEATKNVNYSILPGTTEVRRNSPQDLEAIKSRAERLKEQNVVGFRDTGSQFFKHTRDSKLDLNPQQFPRLTSNQERAVAEEQSQRRDLINSRLDLLKPRDSSGNRRFRNDTQRLKNQISSYEPQPQEQSYSEYFSGLGNRLANLGTRLVRPVTTGAQQLASYALDQNMLGLSDYVDDDQERLLNASLYHSTGDRDYLTRIKDPRQRVIEAAKPEGYSEAAYDELLSQVPPAPLRRDSASFSNIVDYAGRDRSLEDKEKQLEQFKEFRRFREAQRAAQADFDDRLGDEDFFTNQLVGAQLRPFGDRDQYGQNQRDYFDAAEDSITQAVKNYYGFGEDGGNPPLKKDYSLEGLKSPFRDARKEISDLYANPREYLREVALGLDKNNPLAPYAQQLTGIGITPEERAAEMLGMEEDVVESSLLPLSMNDSQMITGGEDYAAANKVMQDLIGTPEGQQVARQLLRKVNPRLIQIQQKLNALDPNDDEYYNKVTAILDSLGRQDLEALDKQNKLIQRVIGPQQ